MVMFGMISRASLPSLPEVPSMLTGRRQPGKLSAPGRLAWLDQKETAPTEVGAVASPDAKLS
jgi:hypothetical protein